MDFGTGSLVVLILIVSLIYSWSKKLDRRTPPGPWGLPFLGCLMGLNRTNAIIQLQEYKKKYGKIFSIPVGNFNVIVLNDYKLIQEALKKDAFLGRPDFEVWKLRNQGIKNRGILFSDGNANWSEQRRFALRNLRDFGFGKGSMEGLLNQEVEELMDKLKGLAGKEIDLKNNFNCSVFNSLWFIMTGKRFELDNPEFKTLMSILTGHLDKLTIFSFASYYPWPAKVNLIRRGMWTNAMNMNKIVIGLVDQVIEEHLTTFDDTFMRDFVDVYIRHHKNIKDQSSSFFSNEGLQNLRITLFDLFVAGTETTSTTLLWSIWYMTSNLQVQKKLLQEIDSVIGFNRAPNREDKIKMPYLEAFTNEVHRKAAIIPMSVYHKVVKDCEFGGYLFKKGTNVYPNLYDAHYDEQFWGDPKNFRPERFLSEDGTKVLSKEALMPFSTGKRVCLGEALARDTLFFFLAGLLQTFSFRLDNSNPDHPKNDDVHKPNFVSSPPDFKVILTTRQGIND